MKNWDATVRSLNSTSRKRLFLAGLLAEASATVREGDPIDEEADMAGPWWAGVIPIETRFGAPRVAADFTGSDAMPPQYGDLAGKSPDER